jgi:hypothetical protein
MNEEDTFNALRRLPFALLHAEIVRRSFSDKCLVDYIKDNRWTCIEYWHELKRQRGIKNGKR